MNGGVEVTIFLQTIDNTGGPISSPKGGQEGGQEERFLAEFGTIASRVKVDSEINKKILMNNFGVISDEFGRVRKRFGKGSEKEIPNWYFVLELIAFYPEITAEEAAEILGISSRATEKHIKKLKDSGIIERMGGRKEGIWQIKKQA
jgi:ATP-dependent DNA helicase RecG